MVAEPPELEAEPEFEAEPEMEAEPPSLEGDGGRTAGARIGVRSAGAGVGDVTAGPGALVGVGAGDGSDLDKKQNVRIFMISFKSLLFSITKALKLTKPKYVTDRKESGNYYSTVTFEATTGDKQKYFYLDMSKKSRNHAENEVARMTIRMLKTIYDFEVDDVNLDDKEIAEIHLERQTSLDTDSNYVSMNNRAKRKRHMNYRRSLSNGSSSQLNIESTMNMENVPATNSNESHITPDQARHNRFKRIQIRRSKVDRGIRMRTSKFTAHTTPELVNFGSPTHVCRDCGAIVWLEERLSRNRATTNPTFKNCCQSGGIQLPPVKEMPDFLQQLLSFPCDCRSRKFRDQIRIYNSIFAFTSMGGRIDSEINRGGGPYCFRLNGQNHHKMGSLLPLHNQKPRFCQLYIYDTDNEMHNRMSIMSSNGYEDILDPVIVSQLITMLNENNELVKWFRMARDRMNEDNEVVVRLILKTSRSTDDRVQNMPQASEITGLLVGDELGNDFTRDVIVEHSVLGLQRISDTHPSFMALQYPLLFPFGEDGFHEGIKYKIQKHTRTCITMREYYAYRMHERIEESNALLNAGRLWQQYIVDAYTCIEEERLNWVKTHQDKLRVEVMSGLRDAIFRGDTDASNVGQRIMLPASFTGGPRYMIQNYQDAIAICRTLGNPDLFLTVTCNPKWQEIREVLNRRPGQKSEDRPELTARVFKMKLDHLMDDLIKRNFFGVVIGAVYTIEFQKRGLPHAHIVLWLHPQNKLLTPQDIDKIISAEIPDPNVDPNGYAAVAKHMMHGPCGVACHSSPCMIDGKCIKKFPKSFTTSTMIDESGFPIYKRKDAHNIYVERNGIRLDNGFVVPYNRDLILRYDCHINVEWCNKSRSIKYLFKYIEKGHDRGTILIQQLPTNNGRHSHYNNNDEVSHYLDCRYISASEASWRIFAFDIHYREPSVERLPFHLEGEKNVTFQDNDDPEQVLHRGEINLTKFEGWFVSNQAYPHGRALTYADYPTMFVWNPQSRKWSPRQRGRSIGRLSYCHPAAGERFYLRMLLNVVRGATCYSDLRFVAGVHYETYKETCYALRLLGNDKEWDDALLGASFLCSGYQIRNLFVAILIFCEVAEPKKLWERNWKLLSEGILERQRRVLNYSALKMSDEQLQNYCLCELQNTLHSCGRTLEEFGGIPLPDETLRRHGENSLIAEELNHDRDALANDFEHLYAGLNTEQLSVFKSITDAVYNHTGGFFFVYGHGGTGKTYLWRTIVSKLRSNGRIVLTVASSGIASVLLPGGRTAHSRFRIPIALNESSCCNIKQGSQLAELLKITDLIIWDEAPMVHKHCFEALDRSLRDILKQKHNDAVNKPFGGLTVLLGGDFRQILPVIPKGRREDIVQAAINRSYLWNSCKIFKLSINMRLRQADCSNVGYFSNWILDVGDGKVNFVANNDEFDSSYVQIPDYLLLKGEADPIGTIVASTYPDLSSNYKSEKYLKERAILATKNEVVDEINSFMLNLIPGTSSTFLSSDSICKSSDRSADWDALYPIEFLNSLRLPGTPNHRLELKVGAPVMLLRNMNPLLGLCNGTRMIVTNLQSWVVEVKIITGTNIGSKHYIPRMVMTPSDTKFPFQMKRRQFPLTLSFAMTVNKSQGQTLEHVGLYLRQPVFCHGQLYVAISRVSSPQGLKILVDNDDCRNRGVTHNIVYKEVFNNL